MSRLLLRGVALLAALLPATARAEAPAPAPPAAPVKAGAVAGITYKPYLAEVGRSNLELVAQRANVTLADAQISVAKVFSDPTLTVGVASLDISGKGVPTVTTVGLGYTVELGGKRPARIAAATSDAAQARADLDDFSRNLRANATGSFIDCLYAQLVLDRKQQTLARLEKLVGINQERLRAGDVGKVALTQSRVEAQRFRGEVLSAEADVEAADLALALYLGDAGKAARAKITAAGDLKIKPRAFDVEALVAQARNNRPDLLSRRRAVESANARVDLARANRWVDVTLNVGWQHSFPSSATGAFPGPAFDALAATMSVPLPLSKVYRGELDAALATEAQGRATVQAAELKIDVEVRQAALRYKAAVDKIGLYTGGLLTDAEQVLDATLYNYQRGGATLLEVLEAQRTLNDVDLSYYEALAEHARALVALEQVVGMWDVEL
jgi:outer membrane protein, heavy metal efflux system